MNSSTTKGYGAVEDLERDGRDGPATGVGTAGSADYNRGTSGYDNVPPYFIAGLPQWTVPPNLEAHEQEHYGPTPLLAPPPVDVGLTLGRYNVLSLEADTNARNRFWGAILIAVTILVIIGLLVVGRGLYCSEHLSGICGDRI